MSVPYHQLAPWSHLVSNSIWETLLNLCRPRKTDIESCKVFISTFPVIGAALYSSVTFPLQISLCTKQLILIVLTIHVTLSRTATEHYSFEYYSTHLSQFFYAESKYGHENLNLKKKKKKIKQNCRKLSLKACRWLKISAWEGFKLICSFNIWHAGCRFDKEKFQ